MFHLTHIHICIKVFREKLMKVLSALKSVTSRRFYRAVLCRQRLWHGKLSLLPSVTLRYDDHRLEYFENNFMDD